LRLSLHHRVVPVAAAASALVFSLGLAAIGAELLRTDAVGASGELPDGSRLPGQAGAEATALNLAGAIGAVPLDETSACPASRLVVSWSEPDPGYRRGAYVDPLGPAPSDSTAVANGLVACSGSTYGFAGFTATWDGERWSVAFVPELGEGDGEVHTAEPGDASQLPSTRSPYALSDTSTWGGRWGADIEPLAAYEPQQVCMNGAQPAVAAFRSLVLQAFPSSADLGIVRGCGVGGLSEHKEGRAWDWGVNVNRPDQRRSAEEVISWLFATDEFGNRFAMARRLGVMYVIWDGHIWSAASAEQGWRPYKGRSAHTDHVHLSFNKAGAAGLTSFWRGAGISLSDLGLGIVTSGLLPPSGGFGFRPEPVITPPPGPPTVLATMAPASSPPGTSAPTAEQTPDEPQPASPSPSPPAAPAPQSAPASPLTPPVTLPPVTVPPVTLPPVTLPPVTLPPVTVPPVTVAVPAVPGL
jgi:hypothetical protein